MISGTLLLSTVALAVYIQLVLKSRALIHEGVSRGGDMTAYLWAMFTDPWTWSALLAAVLGAVLWMLLLRRLDLSFVYPMMGLIFFAVPLTAHFVLGEPLSAIRVAGLVLIVGGITLVASSA